MKTFTRDYRITGGYDPAFEEYFDGMRPCVLDIETTGLSRERGKVILIGFLMRNDSGCTVTQFLAENHYEEYKVLDAAAEYVKSKDAGYFITYNGASFDIPFINSRMDAVFNSSASTVFKLYNLDLLRFIKKSTDLKGHIGSLSQKSVEHYYGISDERSDTITGRESVSMFDEYSFTGNSTLEKIILTHNREDVLHLHRLMYAALAEVHDMHEAVSRYGFPAAGGRLSVRPAIIKSKSRLRITGEQIKYPVSSAYFPDTDSTVTSLFNASSSSFEIDVPLGRLNDNYFIDMCSLRRFSTESPFVIRGIDLSTEPDFVNGYLILRSRSLNLISKLLSEDYYMRSSS